MIIRYETILVLAAVPFALGAVNTYREGKAIAYAIVCAACILSWAYLTGQRMKSSRDKTCSHTGT